MRPNPNIAPVEWPVWQRITSKVFLAPNDCWEWTGALDNSGYARMFYQGRNCRVTRIAWTIANKRDWPEGKHALHSCDNRRCVNPAHIRPGTNAQNIQEAWDRGGLSLRKVTNKSHCRHGHRLTPENTITYPSLRGTLRCRECSRISWTAQNHRRKAGAK